MEQFKYSEPILDVDKLTAQLEEMNLKINEGMGVDCIKTLIMFLKNGEIDKAKACCFNEGDKISSWTEFFPLLKEMFRGEEMIPYYLKK